MYIQKKHSWQLPDSAVTAQSHYIGRRKFLRTCGLGLAAGAMLPAVVRAATFGFPDSLNPADKLPELSSRLTKTSPATTIFTNGGLIKAIPKSTPTGAGRPSRGRSTLAVYAQNPANMMSMTFLKPSAGSSSAITGTDVWKPGRW